MTYTVAGEYRYELRHAVGTPQTGYTYDPQVYTVVVYAYDNGFGMRAVAVVYDSDGNKILDITFAQRYAPLASDPSLMVDPPVKKTVRDQGEAPETDGTFTFQLEAEDPSYPMPTGSANGIKEMVIIGPGEKDFGTWSYTQTGVYVYRISEINNHEAGYAYDTTIYTITDEVTDEGGQLVNTRTITNPEDENVDAYAFVNRYAKVQAELATDEPTETPAGTAAATVQASEVNRVQYITRVQSDNVVRYGSTSPKTGDNSKNRLYRSMLCLSGLTAVLVCVMIWWRKKRNGTVSPIDPDETE
jgi:pilin isopeptide linkage protein